MARIARFVVPGLPHLVTQRGNRRLTVFFSDDDYRLYLDLLSERCRKAEVEVWSYCLMPNHLHLILTPTTPEGLGQALGETHRRYSSVINARLRVSGHLFQSRYGSVVVDEEHLMAAARYVALNPVRARLRRPRAGLALVERRRPSPGECAASIRGGWGRSLRHDRADPGALRGRFRRSNRDGAGRSATGRSARRRNNRPPARVGALSRPHRILDRPRRATRQTRAEEERKGKRELRRTSRQFWNGVRPASPSWPPPTFWAQCGTCLKMPPPADAQR